MISRGGLALSSERQTALSAGYRGLTERQEDAILLIASTPDVTSNVALAKLAIGPTAYHATHLNGPIALTASTMTA
jgi:hypothetical protein